MQKLFNGEKLRILFLNDLGFQYGAGVATLRQIQSFLIMGHEVKGLCWQQGPEGDIPFIHSSMNGCWTGMRQLPNIHTDYGCSEEDIINTIVQEVKSINPDVIIVGNLHGAKWPLRLFSALRRLDSLLVAYMHDCYLIFGRCAYAGACRLHENECNDNCPTADEYPQLAPHAINAEWKLRRELFSGKNGIPLAANSHWTLGMAQNHLRGLHFGAVVYLGLDDKLFKPIDKALARKLLGIPPDKFVILGGAVNVGDKRKGVNFFLDVVSKLSDKADFIVFGHESMGLKGVHAMGLLRDYRKMPLLFSAADLFVGTAVEEAFGLTLCEAAASAVPIVAFNVGGVPEVAVHNTNAILVDNICAEGLIEAIEFFMRDPDARESFGRAGRALVEANFTLQKQGERWIEYLRSYSEYSNSGMSGLYSKFRLLQEKTFFADSNRSLVSSTSFSKPPWVEGFSLEDGLICISKPQRFAHDESKYDKQYNNIQHDMGRGRGLLNMLRELCADFTKPALEIGCGTGVLSLGMATSKAYPAIVLTDPSPDFLKLTQTKLRNANITDERILFGILSAEDIDRLPKDEFSLIVLRSVLHHILNVSDFIVSAAGLLSRGGIFTFEEPCMEGYILMGAMAQFIPMAIEHSGITLSSEQANKVRQFIDTMRFYARRDVDKSAAEDKHLFRVDEILKICAEAGLSVDFIPNTSYEYFASPDRDKQVRFSFYSFFHDYLKFCMSFDPELMGLFEKYFRYYCGFVEDLCAASAAPYMSGIFVCRKM